MVKGYAYKKDIYFNEIFSPVINLATIRVILALCAAFDFQLEQVDAKTVFLHGEIEEEIYICSNRKALKNKEKKTWFAG